MKWTAVLVLTTLLSGCGHGAASEPSSAPLTVPEALSQPSTTRTVRVDGYVLAHPDGSVRLCAGLSGSYPPQCGGPALTVRGLDLARLDQADHASGVTWARATLTGILSRSVLTIED